MKERFERHRQPWRADELHKLRTLAGKGVGFDIGVAINDFKIMKANASK